MMKTKLFILGMAAALAVGCSNEVEDLIAETPIDKQQTAIEGDDETIDEDAPVEYSDIPLEFAFADAQLMEGTRAFIESNPFVCKDMGLFALPRRGIDGTKNTTIDWSGSSTSESRNELNQWLMNVPIEMNEDATGGGVLTWKDGSEKKFYPKANSYYKYAYAFGAFHPRTENISVGGTSIYLYYGKLDGSQDIITGISSPPTDDTGVDDNGDPADRGFSASYYKAAKEESRTVSKPKLTFTHMMGKMEIYIKLDNSYTGTRKFYVDSVWTNALPDSMRVPLMVVDKTAGTVTKPSYLRVYYNTTRPYYLRDFNDESLHKYASSYELSKSLKRIGDCIMIPPMKSSNMYFDDTKNTRGYTAYSTITVHIRLLDDEDNLGYNYKVSVAPPTNGWKEGKRYPININIVPDVTDYEVEFGRAELMDPTLDDEFDDSEREATK